MRPLAFTFALAVVSTASTAQPDRSHLAALTVDELKSKYLDCNRRAGQTLLGAPGAPRSGFNSSARPASARASTPVLRNGVPRSVRTPAPPGTRSPRACLHPKLGILIGNTCRAKNLQAVSAVMQAVV